MFKALKALFQNKKILILTLGLVIVFSFFPSHSAQAGIGDIWDAAVSFFSDPIGAVSDLGIYFITLPIRITVFIICFGIFLLALGAGFLFFLFGTLLNWIINASFSIGIIPGGANTPDVVTWAWQYLRDLSNIFFILILVFIGLATILRIRDYEAKKLLPWLIIMALMINFSGVLVGFMVDISNIVAHSLLQGSDLSTFKVVYDPAFDFLVNAAKTTFTTLKIGFEILNELVGILVYGIGLLVFFIYALYVYFLAAAVFVGRIIWLWTLMILAPIAFASYVLPATRRAWTEWWKHLLQWALVVVPLSFFLYISGKIFLMDARAALGGSDLQFGGGVEGFLSGFIVNILAPLLGLFMLHIGLKISKKLAPEGAIAIMKGADTLLKTAAAAGVIAATGGAAAGLAARGIGGMASQAGRLNAAAGRLPKGARHLAKPFTKTMSTTAGTIEKATVPQLLKYKAKTGQTKLPEGFDNLSAKEQAQYWMTTNNWNSGRRLNALNEMQKNNSKWTEAIEEHKIYETDANGNLVKRNANGNIDPTGSLTVVSRTRNAFREEVAKVAKKNIDNLAYKEKAKDALYGAPELMDAETLTRFKLAGKVTPSEKQKARNELQVQMADIAQEIQNDPKCQIEIQTRINNTGITRTQAERDMQAAAVFTKKADLSQMSKSSLDYGAVGVGSMYWDGKQIAKAIERHGKDFVKLYTNKINAKDNNGNLVRGADWWIANNHKGFLYLAGNAAQDAGLSSVEGVQRQRARRLVETARQQGWIKDIPD